MPSLTVARPLSFAALLASMIAVAGERANATECYFFEDECNLNPPDVWIGACGFFESDPCESGWADDYCDEACGTFCGRWYTNNFCNSSETPPNGYWLTSLTCYCS